MEISIKACNTEKEDNPPLDSEDSSYCQPGSNIVGKQQPFISVFKLIPVAIAAQRLFILFLKRMTVYMIEFPQAYGRSPGMSPYVSFKKAQILWSNVCFWLQHQDLSVC